MSKKPTYAELEKRIDELQSELSRLKTESQRGMEALEESETRFAIIFESSPVPTALARLSDNELVDFNPAMLELTGYERHDIVGKSANDLNLYASPDTRAQLLNDLKAHSRVANYEFQIRTKSGEILDLLYSGALIRLNNQPHLISIRFRPCRGNQ